MSLIFSLTKHLLSTFTGPHTRIAVNQHSLCFYLPTLLFFHVPAVPSFIFRVLNSHYGQELYCIVKHIEEKKKKKEVKEKEEMEKMGKEENGKEERKEGRKEGRREKGRKEERKEDY